MGKPDSVNPKRQTPSASVFKLLRCYQEGNFLIVHFCVADAVLKLSLFFHPNAPQTNWNVYLTTPPSTSACKVPGSLI